MEIVRTIITIVATLITTLVPSAIALYKAIKAKQTAQTVAAAEQAQNAINTEIKRLVANAEVSFSAIDAMLKSQGGTAGAMKKRDVVIALKAFCLENGYAWDDTEMNRAIEDEVAFTKAVNAK